MLQRIDLRASIASMRYYTQKLRGEKQLFQSLENFNCLDKKDTQSNYFVNVVCIIGRPKVPSIMSQEQEGLIVESVLMRGFPLVSLSHRSPAVVFRDHNCRID